MLLFRSFTPFPKNPPDPVSSLSVLLPILWTGADTCHHTGLVIHLFRYPDTITQISQISRYHHTSHRYHRYHRYTDTITRHTTDITDIQIPSQWSGHPPLSAFLDITNWASQLVCKVFPEAQDRKGLSRDISTN